MDMSIRTRVNIAGERATVSKQDTCFVDTDYSIGIMSIIDGYYTEQTTGVELSPHVYTVMEQFIEGLINTKSQETISRVIPQKGTFVDVGNRVLIGLVTNSSRKGYLQSFIDGNATLYYTGSHFPTTIALQDLHYFMPYFKGEGIRDVYEIVRVRTITSKEAKQTDGEENVDDLRLAFELRYVRKQYADIHPINTSKMINYTFINTTFDELNKIVI